TKIAIGAYVRGSIPISYQSQFQGLITQLAGGVNLKKNVYNFNLQIGLAASKNFNRMTTAAFPCSSSAIGPLTLVPGEAPDVSQADVLEGFQNGICRPGDTTTKTSLVNTDWALIPNGSVAYNFTDKLQLSVAFYYLSSFQYPVPVDQFSPQGTTTSGQAVVSGQQRSDSLWGITSLSYAIDPHWGLSLALWNVALPKTANGSTFRFPLLDTYALNSNDWNLFFDVSATF